MPRYPRKYSKTGMHHIMLRGNERKDIFIDEEDKGKFIKIVFDKKADGAFLKKIKFIKKGNSYFNWSKSGYGKKSVKRTVPLTMIIGGFKKI